MSGWRRGPDRQDWNRLVEEWMAADPSRPSLPPEVLARAAGQVQEQVNLLGLPPALGWDLTTGEVTGRPVDRWHLEDYHWLVAYLAEFGVPVDYSPRDGPTATVDAVAALLAAVFRAAALDELDDCTDGRSPATRPRQPAAGPGLLSP
jgi:hypothetical protein